MGDGGSAPMGSGFELRDAPGGGRRELVVARVRHEVAIRRDGQPNLVLRLIKRGEARDGREPVRVRTIGAARGEQVGRKRAGGVRLLLAHASEPERQLGRERRRGMRVEPAPILGRGLGPGAGTLVKVAELAGDVRGPRVGRGLGAMGLEAGAGGSRVPGGPLADREVVERRRANAVRRAVVERAGERDRRLRVILRFEPEQAEPERRARGELALREEREELLVGAARVVGPAALRERVGHEELRLLRRRVARELHDDLAEPLRGLLPALPEPGAPRDLELRVRRERARRVLLDQLHELRLPVGALAQPVERELLPARSLARDRRARVLLERGRERFERLRVVPGVVRALAEPERSERRRRAAREVLEQALVAAGRVLDAAGLPGRCASGPWWVRVASWKRSAWK